ncbi:helix-turn-helix domain-containing protein [Haloparvum sp. PAK95]|uniref:helix-turn-helix domain-containing protein n=1 Tax=Haloparvum sp. PAK95 TaxID=3418962 RepID=UPI003D2EA871
MAKYSTGSSGAGNDGDACELCGTETANLSLANVAGAELLVCSDCSPHDDNAKRRSGTGGGHGASESGASGGAASDGDRGNGTSRSKRAAQKQAQMYDAATGDSEHWEKEGTDYEKDQLPYLVSGYGDRAEQARQDAGYTIEELAETLDVAEDDLLAVEQSRAATAGVGGSVVEKLERELDVDLVDE